MPVLIVGALSADHSRIWGCYNERKIKKSRMWEEETLVQKQNQLGRN